MFVRSYYKGIMGEVDTDDIDGHHTGIFYSYHIDVIHESNKRDHFVDYFGDAIASPINDHENKLKKLYNNYKHMKT